MERTCRIHGLHNEWRHLNRGKGWLCHLCNRDRRKERRLTLAESTVRQIAGDAAVEQYVSQIKNGKQVHLRSARTGNHIFVLDDSAMKIVSYDIMLVPKRAVTGGDSVDIKVTIKEVRSEITKLQRVLETLEKLEGTETSTTTEPSKVAGQRKWSPAKKRAASRRMKLAWQKRKASQTKQNLVKKA